MHAANNLTLGCAGLIDSTTRRTIKTTPGYLLYPKPIFLRIVQEYVRAKDLANPGGDTKRVVRTRGAYSLVALGVGALAWRLTRSLRGGTGIGHGAVGGSVQGQQEEG